MCHAPAVLVIMHENTDSPTRAQGVTAPSIKSGTELSAKNLLGACCCLNLVLIPSSALRAHEPLTSTSDSSVSPLSVFLMPLETESELLV